MLEQNGMLEIAAIEACADAAREIDGGLAHYGETLDTCWVAGEMARYHGAIAALRQRVRKTARALDAVQQDVTHALADIAAEEALVEETLAEKAPVI